MDLTSITIGQLLAKGGATMLPIYLCSLATIAVFVRKFLEFKSYRFSDLNWLDPVLDLVRKNDLNAAEASCASSRHPAAQMVESMLIALRDQPQQAQAEGQRVGSAQLLKIEKNLGLLSFLAQVAPLFGLLGTVIGMVDMFLGLQNAGTANIDIAVLAGGIWKALLTTAAGLCVAVPALAAYSYLGSQADLMRQQFSEIAQRLIYTSGLRDAV